MRFLKNKIALAAAFYAQKNEAPKTKLPPPSFSSEDFIPVTIKIEIEPIDPIDPIKSVQKPKRKADPGSFYTSEASRATKNIVKNFGRAICSFAISHLALTYLEKILQKEGLLLSQFIRYMKQIRATIDGLHHFRSTLLISEDDSQEIAAAKRAFAAIGEVFIKNFSVNWIFHSRVFHKEAHLKFRYKMLRRIRNPELFTYLTDFNPSGKKSE